MAREDEGRAAGMGNGGAPARSEAQRSGGERRSGGARGDWEEHGREARGDWEAPGDQEEHGRESTRQPGGALRLGGARPGSARDQEEYAASHVVLERQADARQR